MREDQYDPSSAVKSLIFYFDRFDQRFILWLVGVFGDLASL